MDAKIHQCLVIPKLDTEELIQLGIDAKFYPNLTDATRLAETMADEEGEPYLVVQVVRIVNPRRRNER